MGRPQHWQRLENGIRLTDAPGHAAGGVAPASHARWFKMTCATRISHRELGDLSPASTLARYVGET